MKRILSALTVSICLLGSLAPASAIDRIEVMDRARAYARHPWHCAAANRQAPCRSSYSCEFTIGDHRGLPYDWGGFVSLHEFDLDIDAGEGAGTPPGGDVAACTTGVDCSGYVSACWDTGQKYGTWTILDVASELLSDDDLLAGDAFNEPGYHITLYADELADGSLRYWEAMPPVVWLNSLSSWSGVSGFDRIRYDGIEPGGSDLGTLANPIRIRSWPYSDSRDTRFAPSDLLDACAASPTTDESGREFVYLFELTSPGRFTATVADGTGVDIDLHLYRHEAERDCFARHDSILDLQLDACGTYLLVLDTYVNGSGTELAGLYDLEADLVPSGGACQPMPGYEFVGAPGQPCANPYDSDLPFCNPNLDALTCLYSASDSFCSRPCDDFADCREDFPGGCCEALPSGEHYCMPAAYCEPQQPDGGSADGGGAGTDAGQGEDAGGGDDGGGAGADDGASGADDGGFRDAGTGADDGGVGSDDGAAGVDSSGADVPGTDASSGPCPEGWVEIEGGTCAPEGWEPDQGCGCSVGSGPCSVWFYLLVLAWVRRKRSLTHCVGS